MRLNVLKSIALRVGFAGALCCVFSQIGFGQIPNFGASQYQQAIQNQQGQTASQLQDSSPNLSIYQPVIPEQRPLPPPSRLESLYNSRLPVAPAQTRQPPLQAGQYPNASPQYPYQVPQQTVQQPVPVDTLQTAAPLQQFGYEILGVPAPFTSAQLGVPQDGYILGPGDEVIVNLRGPEDQTYNQRVNRDGQVILPKLRPIAAAGRTLGDVRADIERRVSQTYISTNAFISLGQIRQISVLITGDIRYPGNRTLSALATPLDAILVSGGIAKTGSLRNVQLVRGDQTRNIDLYSIITQARGDTVGTLQDGDRIFVPPLQTTVAVAGLVRHPGIYELKDGDKSITSDDLVRLAGGLELGGVYRLSKISLQPDGSTRLEPLPQGGVIANGEILLVNNASELQSDTVALRGAVKLPNAYPLSGASSVRQLIRNGSDLTSEAYTAFALISHRDLALNVRTLEPFSLSQVLSGQRDVKLQNEDIVYILSNREIHDLASKVAQQSPNGQLNNIAPVGPGNQGTQGQPGVVLPGQDNRTLPGGLQNGQPIQNGPPGQNTPVFPGSQNGLLNAYGQTFAGQVPPNAPNAQNGVSFFSTQQQQPNGIPASYLNVPPSGAQTNGGIGQGAPSGGANQQAFGQTNGENVSPRINSDVEIAKALDVSEQVLTGTMNDNLVWVYDQVKDPGPYLAAQGTNLGEIVQMAGGPLRTADLTAVEVTSTTIDSVTGTARTIRTEYKGTVDDFRRVTLQALDVVRFRPVFSDRDLGRVTIMGEVKYPGTFDIRRGERLSSVLARAGGLTDQAYPLGAVFTRRSAAVAELQANLKEARELQTALVAVAQRGSFTSNVTPTSATPTAATTVQSTSNTSDLINNLILELRTTPAIGRITVTADPAVLQVHPETDIVMEGGDQLYIPKRPSTVTVTGEVLNTGSFAYRNELRVQDYIDLAGGTRETADESRIFIVLPDGTARPVQESWLSFTSSSNIIPPGSTVVVPLVIAPFNLWSTLGNLVSLTTITSQLAVTAASLKILGQ